ncbi:MAG: hypothetical protein Q8Q52_02970 [Acidimicrobiia bacterium]|nr:hypothetical protein [Acidimicrobiia bacterium]
MGLPWRRDLDLGRLLAVELARRELPADVVVEDLSYSAHRVMHTLEELRPRKLVLVGAVVRGGPAGEIRRYRLEGPPAEPEEVAERLGESVGGVIDLDHIVVVNRHFGALPDDTVVIEVEAGDDQFGVGYSPDIERAIAAILDMIDEEIQPITGAGRERPQ